MSTTIKAACNLITQVLITHLLCRNSSSRDRSDRDRGDRDRDRFDRFDSRREDEASTDLVRPSPNAASVVKMRSAEATAVGHQILYAVCPA